MILDRYWWRRTDPIVWIFSAEIYFTLNILEQHNLASGRGGGRRAPGRIYFLHTKKSHSAQRGSRNWKDLENGTKHLA